MKNICIDSISPLGGKIKTEDKNIEIDKLCIYCYNELSLGGTDYNGLNDLLRQRCQS